MFSILSLQLAIEQWIINEFHKPKRENPNFKDHYQLVIEKIKNDNHKKELEEFFDALNILRNKAAHWHSNTKISKSERESINKGGFDTTKIIKNNALVLTPADCIGIIKISMEAISKIRSYLNS